MVRIAIATVVLVLAGCGKTESGKSPAPAEGSGVKVVPVDAPAAKQELKPVDAAVAIVDAPPPSRQTEIRDALNVLFRQQSLPAVARTEGRALILMTTDCDRKILSGFRELLDSMKLEIAPAFDTFECSGGYLIRFRGKDSKSDNLKRARRTIRTEAARALSKFFVDNAFPFDVALGDEEATIVIAKACNQRVLDGIASDEVGESLRKGGFIRMKCADGSAARNLCPPGDCAAE